MIRIIQIWGLLLFSLILTQCAQINPLQGGPRDTFAPQIDTIQSYPKNGTTNFQDNFIELKFKEFISLNNPSENIIITPQQKIAPEVEVKNKKLKLTFQEPLEPNTTYTINFNRAVSDITEKNDSIFQVVFSTGAFIDSNQLAGEVKVSRTNRAAANYMIGLYPKVDTIQFDSIPYLSKPYYMAQTNDQGQFNMKYLKAGSYYIFAMDDQNRNLKLNDGESVAFMQNPIEVGLVDDQIEMKAFLPDAGQLKMRSTTYTYPGKITIAFTGAPSSYSIRDLEGKINLEKDLSSQPDSLIYWLAENPRPKMQFLINLQGVSDTIKPLYKNLPEAGKPVLLKMENNLKQMSLLPKDTLKITFSEPLKKWDMNSIAFLDKDSTELPKSEPTQIGLRTLAFLNMDKAMRHLKIDSGAVQSFYAHTIEEPYWASFEQLDTTYFGTLFLNMDSTVYAGAVVELLNKENEVVAKQRVKNRLVFVDLIPGDYQLRLIVDLNGDGEWTTGSIKESRQPEQIIYNKELINIKSKWEKEVDWIIQNE